ncbi:LacI family DNA-binding transcriptional regulator [Streptomyces sp. NPDC059740]|uniref:LacI family DNA-binding transcriptional regulator n=1 Tax=Streptomyces sp. NPDC059740 TaxID=3346926 RepID=UPI003654AC2C
MAARPRIKDVARYAGVSEKTVSNVINDYQHVSDRTRQAVREAIDALGYRVNLAGRQLRTGRTGTVALAVPELDVAYFSELAKHVVEAAEERSWTVLVHQTGARPERESAALRGFESDFVDGVLLSPLSLRPKDLAAADVRVPLVLLGEQEIPGLGDHVGIDNVAAAREATAHLLAAGRRRIAVVGGDTSPEAAATERLRTEGYQQALAAAGLPFDPGLLVPVEEFHWRDGATATAALVRRRERPDALLCLNDHLAIGALRALHEAGLSTPREVSVVGFDDIQAADFTIPSLTTVAPDKPALARTAVDLLAHRIEAGAEQAGPPALRRVGHRLVVRESSVPPPGGDGREG